MKSGPSSAGVLVIGYGNSLRSDDGAGPSAARRLAELGYHAVVAHQLTPELAEPISAQELVIFIDADVRVPPGNICVRAVAEPNLAPMTRHSSMPAELLALARDLYGRAPAAVVIGIGAKSFDFGGAIGARAQAGVQSAVAAARSLADLHSEGTAADRP